MAVGNTFGATALSSYGGFWISFAIIFTPGGFQIESELEAVSANAFADELGLYLIGWFIFTFILVICTLRSTVAFFSLFFSLDMAFMLLGIGYLHRDAMNMPNTPIIKAGGFFALLAAFLAWYNALAGIADDSNRYVASPTFFADCIPIFLFCLQNPSPHPSLFSLNQPRTHPPVRRLNADILFFHHTASSFFQSSTSRGPSRA